MNKSLLSVYFFISGFLSLAQTPSFEWAFSTGGGGSDIGTVVTVDAQENIYSTGYFEQTVDFDPATPSTYYLTSAGGLDIFIRKLDASGNFIWAKRIGGSGIERANSMTQDNLGNLYLAGTFEGTVDFNPSNQTVFNLTSSGASDIFVLKLDSDGNFVWAFSMGGSQYDYAYSIENDDLGNVYVAGSHGDGVDFDPSSAVVNLLDSDRGYIQKLDSDGNFLWVKPAASNDEYAYIDGIHADLFGDFYVVGSFEGTVDFDPSSNTHTLTSNGARDIYVQKLDSSGNFLWVKSMGGTEIDDGNAITTDVNGNVYLTGTYSDTADFDPSNNTVNLVSNGYSDAFVQKLDSSGNFLWVKKMGGIYFDAGHSIVCDNQGGVYSMGKFEDTVDFDPASTTFNLEGDGMYIQKLDTNGTFNWALKFESSVEYNANSLVISEQNNIFATGKIIGSGLDMDPGPNVFNLTSNGVYDAFVLKLGQCNPSSGTDAQVHCGSYTWIDGVTYTSSNNTATHTLTNAAGCDSVVTLNLTINSSSSGIDAQVHCGSYTWIDGVTYTSSNNTATHTLTNAAGCDSVVTLNLTINSSSSGTDAQVHCGSYTWIDGVTYTSSNNTATHTLTNAAGCDSVVTLNLTINSSSSGTDAQVHCGSYTWIDGVTYTTSNNTATHTLTNAAGCDSVVTLNLTINNVGDLTTSVDGLTISATNSSAVAYQWIDCSDNSAIPGETSSSFTATENGSYAVIITDNDCSDTTECIVINDVSIEEILQGEHVEVYPNPSTHYIIVEFEEAGIFDEILILNSVGQVISKYNVGLEKKKEITTTEFSKGIYFLEIRNAKSSLVKRILLQ